MSPFRAALRSALGAISLDRDVPAALGPATTVNRPVPGEGTPREVAGLTAEQVEEFGAALEQLRLEVLASRGSADAAYIRRVVLAQRRCELLARALLMVSIFPPAWIAGTGLLSLAKIIENMELGHNIMHGQWDWMRDPRIHSSTWEWDHAATASEWRYTHNELHHTWTNVLGRDHDIGYGRLRVSSAQEWNPTHLFQLATNALLSLMFEFGIALYDSEIIEVAKDPDRRGEVPARARRLWAKLAPQLRKDYVAFPLLAGPGALHTLSANLTANLVRNVWTHMVIFCGHFPDDVQVFPESSLENETRAGWYLRQVMGSANIDGGPTMNLLTGNLSYQIEHHLFPDLPSNRYSEIAPRVRELTALYGIPYVSGPLHRQYAQVLGSLARLSIPTRSELATWLTPKLEQLRHRLERTSNSDTSVPSANPKLLGEISPAELGRLEAELASELDLALEPTRQRG